MITAFRKKRVSPQERLVSLMQYKQDEINKVSDLSYFNDKDRDYLLDLEDEDAETVIDTILHDLKEYKDYYSEYGVTIDADNCPFCILVDTACRVCPYAKRHGMCDNKGSDYQEVSELSIELSYNRLLFILED